jgi:hypothetical protein
MQGTCLARACVASGFRDHIQPRVPLRGRVSHEESARDIPPRVILMETK